MKSSAVIVAALTLVASPLAAETAPAGRPAPIKLGQPGKPAGVVPKNFTQDAALDALLKQPLQPRSYSWSAGSQPVLLDPVKTHLCLLTGVSGNFAGGGEHITVGIDEKAAGGPRWVLGGVSGQAELRATAMCVARSKFTPGMLSPNAITVTQPPLALDTDCGPVAHNIGTTAVGGHAFFLREIVGKWRGGGESFSVGQQGKAQTLRGRACSGYAGAGVVGIGMGAPVKYLGHSGATASSSNATFVTQYNGGTDWPDWGFGGDDFYALSGDTVLVPVDRAFCGFVGLSGKFQGYGESAEIVPEVHSGLNMWTVKLSNGAKVAFINAAVRCIARDQR